VYVVGLLFFERVLIIIIRPSLFQKPVCGNYGGNMIYKVKAKLVDELLASSTVNRLTER
jgi:hypothetical protein